MNKSLDPEKSLLSQTHLTVAIVKGLNKNLIDDLKRDLDKCFGISGIKIQQNEDNMEVKVPRLIAYDSIVYFIYGWVTARQVEWVSFE